MNKTQLATSAMRSNLNCLITHDLISPTKERDQNISNALLQLKESMKKSRIVGQPATGIPSRGQDVRSLVCTASII